MNFFGFMDETGILTNSKDQPYFALGLLRLSDTSKLLQTITSIKAKHKGIFQAECAKNGKNEDFEIGELKFNSLSQNKYLPLYKDIVEACLSHKYFYFSTILIDKKKIPLQENNTWNLQLSFAKEHIKQNCKNSKIAIIADYLNKPKEAPYFEEEMNTIDQVFNACMLESNTSVFIQIVDIFIGAIIYRYKNPNDTKRLDKAPKMQLVHFIENKLEENYRTMQMSHKGNYDNNKKIQGNFTIFGNDFYFSIYEKKLKE
ncbi:hypothetical protein HPU229336_05160 [Helicobacter pullorum]|uniref:DUF3800 domain-containing protein n=1 Tax=Helicobacter pullorum TaxID=35818 RepID=A0AAW3J4C8_9HELI|nr:DUF3800 domain-containing protein [Helicobacter pullorum]KPH49972.1 hypothetical protein HPU229336_05160 [Helicobacter pullorum]